MTIRKNDYIKLDTGEVGQVINISSDNEIVDIKLNNGEFESVQYGEVQLFRTDSEYKEDKIQDMRNWTYNEIENSIDDRDTIMNKFVSKFGKSNLNVFLESESEILD